MRPKQRFLPAFLVILIMAIMIASYVAAAYALVKPDPDRICRGVYADEIDLSNMTKEEAKTVIDKHIGNLSQRTLTVDVNGKTVSTTLAELGFACEADPVIEEALKIGKEGNLFENYAQIRQVQEKHVVYSLSENYSDDKLKTFIEKKCAKKCSKAKNAKIKMKNGQLVYTDSIQGESLDVEGTMEHVKNALKEQSEAVNVQVTAVVNIQEPKVSGELVSRCRDQVGTFSTNFSASNISRSKNVANAARLINGSVVYPGETFSVHDAISPMTEENGYYAAPSYNNGEVVDSIGGGVCQVSTTLYNAVLLAELEIVERSPHSMVVAYVKPSMDAAIAGDYKDFKFRNNTDVPIYIEGGTVSGSVYFRLYGEETRNPKRKVKYVSETIETIDPGEDKITYDKTKPESYTKVTQEAHIGYKAILWKVVTEKGKTTKTQVNSSTYKAEPRYVTKGSAKATPSPEPDNDKKPAASSKPGKIPKTTKEPKSTSVPAATQEPASTKPPASTAIPGPAEDGGE